MAFTGPNWKEKRRRVLEGVSKKQNWLEKVRKVAYSPRMFILSSKTKNPTYANDLFVIFY
ncbi:hypothetical protein [Bacillus oleivorans]|uniref:hypothetical protein n=1 Tax=Bacillus oleivorans TaxID=1448271 RepID=UPI000BE296BD|nr:hypothetical protein [Bacillus oleivorans]